MQPFYLGLLHQFFRNLWCLSIVRLGNFVNITFQFLIWFIRLPGSYWKTILCHQETLRKHTYHAVLTSARSLVGSKSVSQGEICFIVEDRWGQQEIYMINLVFKMS